jgi:hypothetical protein
MNDSDLELIADMKFQSGSRVRLRRDPTRIGVLTTKSRQRGGRWVYQVQFTDRTEWQPEYELDLVEDGHDDAYELLTRSRFGRAADLRRSLTFLHLSGRLANLVYSMETTNVDFYAYQYKPVLSFLESPSNGLLIADEVGLGKTIEAGLIWTELRARYDARRLVVFCPAMLREKWRDELRERFGVDAVIIGAKDLLEELKNEKHLLPAGKGFVCSIQGSRPPSGWQPGVNASQSAAAELASFLQESADREPIIDLVVIDEAHYLRNPQTQTARLGRLLRDVTENLILLSATPINLGESDLFHLLKLVDPDSFYDVRVFPEILAANEPLVRAARLIRDKTVSAETINSTLHEALDHRLLSGSRQLHDICSDIDQSDALNNDSERIRIANRIEKVNLLRHVVTRTKKRDVNEWQVIRRAHKQFVDLPAEGPERALYDSVTEAIRQYAEQQGISEGFLLATPQRQVSSSMYAAVRSWRGPETDEDIAYEDLGIDARLNGNTRHDRGPLINHISRTVLPTVDLEVLRKNDSKYDKLISILVPYLEEYTDEKIILFSYFRATLEYLLERLTADGISCEFLVGGMKQSKQEIIHRFRESPVQQVLLSSEVASEGVDLQFSRLLINYDLPWNPMKVEQRIGRIDRLGQQSPRVEIWNLLYADTIDQRIHDRLMTRIGVFERALGGLEAILGSQIQRLSVELFSKRLTIEEENERIDKASLAIEQAKKDEEELEREATNLIAHSDYILEKVTAAREFNRRITAEDLIGYVRDYLQSYWQGHQFYLLDEKTSLYEILLPTKLAANFQEFMRTEKLVGGSRLSESRGIHCQFSNRVGRPGDRAEQISQFHPFVRFISHDLNKRNEGFYPLVAIELIADEKNTVKSGFYVFALNRWHFHGMREEEDLRAQAINLGSEAVLDPDESWLLVNECRLKGKDWMSVDSSVDPELVQEAFNICTEKLESYFEVYRNDREFENKDRVEFQVRSAEQNRNRQLESLKELVIRYEQEESRMLAPTQGRIEHLKKRFEVRVAELKRKAELTSRQEEICFGVVNVVDSTI